MPVIGLKHIRSFSSEDSKFPAANLLKGDGFKKWKSATVGEKQVSVVMEFDKASEITSVDIGNEGSAFIEILVARSSGTAEPDFQVLLVASSFMSPQESRNTQNLNRVRMFDKDKLTKSLLGQKWDLVKVVCTQPFNKNIQYGLSFIKFHSSDSGERNEGNLLGMFKLKETKKEDLKVGSAFQAFKAKGSESAQSPSASARSVSKFADEVLARETALVRDTAKKDNVQTPKRKIDDSSSGKRDSPRIGGQEKKLESRRRSPSPKRRSPSPKRRKESTGRSSPSLARKEPAVKPFSKLMSAVVFAMSGYQNPERGEIRDMATAMGATYKPDWSRACTHLICAFENTPKYQVVKGKGRIVNADWIKRCSKEKKLLSWRKFRVGTAKTPPGSSDEECIAEEISKKVQAKPKEGNNKINKEPEQSTSNDSMKPSTSKTPKKNNTIVYEDSDDSVYEGDTDVDDDTEDEIERVKNSGISKTTDAKKGKERLELPDFFKGKSFLFYGDMTPGERRILRRLIIAYGGELEDYMGDSVTHVVTKSQWDENFDKALGDNGNLVFVRPEWVFECDGAGKAIKVDEYCVTCD